VAETRSIEVGTIPVHPMPVDPAASAALLAAPEVAWPEPGVAEVGWPRHHTGTHWLRAGELPVFVAPAGIGVRPASARVEVTDRPAAQRAGVAGIALRLSGGPGRIGIRIDYAGFRYGYGADWARRLRLTALPSCSLTTPELAGCTEATPLPTDNDTVAGTLTTELDLTAGVTVVALAAEPSSDAGDYAATSLSASATWTAGGSSGDFGWSYPLRTPPAVGGPAPDLAIAYSAQSVDGRTASTNNQPSWIGEGFDLATSYVERKYAACVDDGRAGKFDLCWKYDNASLVLNGRAAELVRDDASGAWRLSNDDGSRVEKLTNPVANGDSDREYWRVTGIDGTQYVFGLHQLPGWSTGKPVTNSVWTVPVAGDDAGEPCHSGSGFSASFCTQAWRWNLDYVVDPHGNVMTAWYSPETNYYAKNGVASPGTSYVRGGWLTRYDYGQRSNTIFTTAAPARVVFAVAERCIPSGTETCASLTTTNKSAWPDVPFDQICASGTACTGRLAPTFFTRKRLTAVTTQVWRGSAHADVDSWVLTQSFPPPGDGGSPALWLSKITHSGKVGGTLTLPAVSFGGTQLENRVDALEGIAPVTKWRVRTITSETGGGITVNYAPTECTRTALPAPDSNTKRCFPAYWTPPGQTEPQRDWFHKYVVAQVLQVDSTGGGEIVQTDHAYSGGGAWHYDDDDGLTPDKYRTWSGWRGYQRLTVTTGDPVLGAARLETETLFLRGMHGDRTASGGSKSVTVTDSQGGTIADTAPLAGFLREQLTYDRGIVVTGTINGPWTHQTAARTHSWGTVRAHFVRTADVRTRTPLAAGGTRWTRSTASFDSTYGLPTQTDDLGDEATASDDRCDRVEYARNLPAHLVEYERRTETVGVRCSATPSRPGDVVSDVRISYDGQAWGAAPSKGDPTRTERVSGYSSGAPVYQTVSTSTYDGHGRITKATNALGQSTTTGYTPASGGPLTQTVVTNPLGHATTTTVDPGWGLPTVVVDPNGRRNRQAYDAIGRVTAVWRADRTDSQNPNLKFAYTIAQSAPVAVASSTLRTDGTTYTTSFEIYDSWLRPRQVQTPAPGGGRVITDTSYDSRGLAVRVLDDIYNSSAPSAGLVSVNPGAAPAQTRTSYDGAGRVTVEAFLVLGEERWRTTTTYGGDRVTVDPPAGAIAATEVTDGRGRTAERWAYDSGAPTGPHTTTRYGYDDADRLVAITGPAGAEWSYSYDLRGRRIEDADPDKGVTTFSYDELDREISTVDARGQTLAHTYDALGRKTGLYAGAAAPVNQLAGWTYDTGTLPGGAPAKGQPAAATRYVGGATGAAYVSRFVSYDNLYRPTKQQTAIPAAETGLAGTYTTTTGYNLDGTVQFMVLPAAGGLGTEVLTFGHNELGLPTTLTGLSGYIADTMYSKLSQPEQYTLATSSLAGHAWLTMSYETGTGRLLRSFVVDETNPVAPTDRNYSYDPAGNPTRIADVAGTQDDVQCFGYDGLQRLTTAWTPSSGTCATPSVTGLGGPAPYWLSWTYTASGLRASQTDHRGTGDITTTYAYPAPTAPGPHTLTSTTTGSTTNTYGYDPAGNTISRPGQASTQTLTWDAEGRSASITEGSSVSEHLYDADGLRLIRRDPAETVLYLGHTEVHRAAAGALTGVRHYTHNGATIAVRTNAGLSWLIPDHQGTPQVTIDATTQAVTRRYQTPFGGARGSVPGWPSQKGYVGGVTEPAAGLVRLGARDYDPGIGRFLSVDPVIAPEDPQSLAAYPYANNNPVTHSDPSGLITMAGGGGGSYTAPRYTSHANEVIRFRNKVTADRITSSQAKRRAVVHRQEVIRFRNKVTADRIAHSRINRSGMARRDAPKPRPRITGPAFTGLFPQGPPARGAFIPSPQGPSIGPAYPLGTFNSQGYGTPDTPYPSGSCSKLKFIEDKGTLVLSEPLVYRDRVPIQGHPDIGAVRSEHYATFGFSTVRARLYLDTHTGNYVIGLSGVEKVSRDGVQMSLAPRGARSALPFYDGPAGGWKPGWPEEM
jgi:RHS repeat-associated protein